MFLFLHFFIIIIMYYFYFLFYFKNDKKKSKERYQKFLIPLHLTMDLEPSIFQPNHHHIFGTKRNKKNSTKYLKDQFPFYPHLPSQITTPSNLILSYK
jgi:hypothetical protein